MPGRMRLLFSVFILFVCILPAHAEEKKIEQGTCIKTDIPKTGSYFLYYVPKSCKPDEKAPLLIFAHAQGKKPEEYTKTLTAVSEKFGMVLLLPKSTASNWQIQTCQAVVKESIRLAEPMWKLDANRVYFAGHSSGTHVAYLLTYIFPGHSKGVLLLGANRFISRVSRLSTRPPAVLYYGEKDPLMGQFGGYNLAILKKANVKTTVLSRPDADNSSCPEDVFMEAFELFINGKQPEKTATLPEVKLPTRNRQPAAKMKDWGVSKIKLDTALNTAPEVKGGADAWYPINLGFEANIHAVHFPTPLKGCAVGNQGLILCSEDGGKTWMRRESGLKNADLYGVFFLDEQNGWACGGIGDGPPCGGHIVSGRPRTAAAVLKTTDGGKTWKKVWAPTNFHLTGIWMLNKDRGMMVSHGGGHADGDTIPGTNGGTKWRTRRVYRGLRAVKFVDDKVGYAVGSRVSVGFRPEPKDPLFLKKSCRMVKSTDSGKTWKPMNHPSISGRKEVLGLGFADKLNGWACGSGGLMFHTIDAGKTWTRQTSGVNTDLSDIAALDSKRAWAVGDKGVILYTADSGKTWKKIESGTTSDLYKVSFTSAGHGVAVGAKGTVVYYSGTTAAE